ncbi:MAG TPA: hypothetical protein VGB37_12050 [Candidatus Lokiarchaeia archaeon]
MKYIITRTSSDYKNPCEEAFKMSIPCWHIRTCSEKEFNEKFSAREGLWKSKGKNHTITKEGCIKRQEDNKKGWGIEIKTLKQLHKFIKKYGDIIITDDWLYNSKIKRIKIYDGYLE